MHQNKKYLNLFIVSCFLVFHSSCRECRYIVTESYIENNCTKFESAIDFQELIVDSFNADGMPAKYEIKEHFDIGLKDSLSKPSEKIFFFKETPGYNWYDVKRGKEYLYLPIEVKPNQWYLIRGLMHFGNPDKQIFIHVDKDGKHNFYYPKTITNW